MAGLEQLRDFYDRGTFGGMVLLVTDSEAIAAIVRITGGNFRLL